MTNAPKPTVVATLDSKVQSLAAFIDRHLPPHHCNDVATEITLLARSADSPVAQALVRHGATMAERGVRVRALFSVVGSQQDAGAWTALDSGLAFDREVRWSHNPRYFDAHEQLVLTAASSWIGDCMRRDPTKRDALDLPKAKCTKSALFAATSFERLWRLATPLAMRASRGKSDALLQELTTAHRQIDDVIGAEIDQNQ